MMDILGHCNPCEPGTNNQFGNCFIPKNFNDYEWNININALNGWVFQNHFDCVISALTGAINTVYNFTREYPLLNSFDIRIWFIFYEISSFLKLFDELILSKCSDSNIIEAFILYLVSIFFIFFFLIVIFIY